MIKLFRNIRKNLLSEGKTTKYFKYAIGEIFLVVIGILIALQINNWNENRKTKLVELELLKNIQLDLVESKKSITFSTKYNKKQIKMYRKILYYVKEDLPYNNSLDSIFGKIPTWSTPYLNYSSYETLKTKGIDLIQNDSLKKQIITIYDNQFAALIGDWDRWEWNINQTISMPFFVQHFRRDSINNAIASANNYGELIKNKEFSNLISVLLFTRNKGISQSLQVGLKIDTLLVSIDKELKNRQ